MFLSYFLLILLCITGTVENAPILSTVLSRITSGNVSSVRKVSSEKLLSRRRGLIPKFRRRGDLQLPPKSTANQLWSEIAEKYKTSKEKRANKRSKSISNMYVSNGNSSNSVQSLQILEKGNGGLAASRIEGVDSQRLHRRRRWDYDENYDWENGGKDYVIPGEEPRKETKFEKFAKSWQKHALKAIFLFSVVCMICCCCLAICKKFCSAVCETICWHLKDYRDICLNRDPTWRKARKFADDYGIELNYDQYEKIKKNYEDGFQEQGHHEYRDLSGRSGR